MVIPAQFERAEPFREHRAAVIDRTGPLLVGYIDPSGQMVIPPQFRQARSFSEGLAPVEVGRGDRSRWGFSGLTGKMVIPARFSDAHEFSEGLAGVSRGDKYGYIDHAGKFVVSGDQTYLHYKGLLLLGRSMLLRLMGFKNSLHEEIAL